MTSVQTLIGYLDDLLKPQNFEDYGPNGLQVPGREEIAVVATGVSAGAELFERAAAEGADLVLVHHGLFWKGPPRGLDRPARRRLQLLFDADMSLAAYHLPLDGHPHHGNNALLAAGLGAEVTGPFADGIGVEARWPDGGLSAAELVGRLRELGGGGRVAGGRAAGHPRHSRAGAVDRNRLRRRPGLLRRCDRRRPRRVPDRR